MKNQDNDTFSLADTTRKCQYHVVFTPKYHRKAYTAHCVRKQANADGILKEKLRSCFVCQLPGIYCSAENRLSCLSDEYCCCTVKEF